MEATEFRVLRTSWERDHERLLRVRTCVFVDEQRVPAEIEIDEHDPVSVHFLALAGSADPIGTARLQRGGRVGRVAVLREWRRRGVGRALMEELLRAAGEETNGADRLTLHAQLESIPFYKGLGFEAEGDAFEEAGILHRHMSRSLYQAS